jgi:hypothetical protein
VYLVVGMKILFDDGCQIYLDEKQNNGHFTIMINSEPGLYRTIRVDRDTVAQFTRPNTAREPHKGGWDFDSYDLLWSVDIRGFKAYGDSTV